MLSRIALAAAIGGLLWQPVRPGVWVSESQMAADGPLSVVRSIAIRVDPARYRFQLDTATRDYGIRGAWTVASLPGHGVVAFNAGQFNAGFPWGWVVRDGVELQPPGSGKLAMAFTVDRDGRAELLEKSEIPSKRERITLAFQSYPALLVDGKIPWELEAPGRGVDVAHRDPAHHGVTFIDLREPTEVERKALADLRDALANLNPDSTAEDIQNVVYEIGRREPFLDHAKKAKDGRPGVSLDWFNMLYQVLLGQEKGPRFGSFVAVYGLQNTVDMIDGALARSA